MNNEIIDDVMTVGPHAVDRLLRLQDIERRRRIDKDRAKELRREWDSKRLMWQAEAAKLVKLAGSGPQKYRINRKRAAEDAFAEAHKYWRWIVELDAILNDNE